MLVQIYTAVTEARSGNMEKWALSHVAVGEVKEFREYRLYPYCIQVILPREDPVRGREKQDVVYVYFIMYHASLPILTEMQSNFKSKHDRYYDR